MAAAGRRNRPSPRGRPSSCSCCGRSRSKRSWSLLPSDQEDHGIHQRRRHEAAGKALELGEAQRKEAFEKLLESRTSKFLADTLHGEAGKRLDQITMQFTALMQLTRPEMAKELKLSDDQVQKFKDLQNEARKALVELIEAKGAKDKTKSSRNCARRPARKSWPS